MKELILHIVICSLLATLVVGCAPRVSVAPVTVDDFPAPPEAPKTMETIPPVDEWKDGFYQGYTLPTPTTAQFSAAQ